MKRPPKRKSGQSRGGIVLAQMLAPGSPSGSIGIAGRCPVCERVSANLVAPEHVDRPFHNDAEIGVVEHVFPGDAERVSRGAVVGELRRAPPSAVTVFFAKARCRR